MEFRVLGPLEVVEEGRALSLGGAKQRALLAVLILHANNVVSTDRLIDDLWGEEPPPSAGHSLEVYVSKLRKAFHGTNPSRHDILVTRRPGYVLKVDPEQVDLHRFERLVAQAREALADGAPTMASTKFREALGLWRGAPLADLAFEPFVQTEAARLEELRLSAIEDRIEADLALGQHSDLVGELQALTAQHPLREGFGAQLMLALYRCGRQAEALQVCQDARRVLADELGIDPGPDLQRLEKAILVQNPELEWVPPATEGAEREEGPEAPSTQPPRSREGRKTVTAAFTEASVSAASGRSPDPEVLRLVMDRFFEAVTGAFERYGGTVERFAGDAVLAVFGVPAVHEDDALRAVRAGVDMREALTRLNKELERDRNVTLVTRTGVNTGEVVTGDPSTGRPSVTGDAVNVAARLARSAGAGEILIGRSTHRLVKDAVTTERVERLSLAGEEGGTSIHRLLGVTPGIPHRLRLDSPMVGRANERALLEGVFERAERERGCHLFTILGAAGVGKSRLVEEFLRGVGDASVLRGRCLPYGEGITFWPVAEVVKEAAGLHDFDAPDEVIRKLVAVLEDEERAGLIAERVAESVGFAEGVPVPEEVFWAIRKFVEALARDRPLVVLFEDIHWGEPTFLDLVEHIVDVSRGYPILLLCIARPDLLDRRPGWGGGKLNTTSILLEPLTEAECERLIDNLLGGSGLAEEARVRITEAAEGNPLFVEEMLSMLIDDLLLRREEGRWVPAADLSTAPIPPTIQALLSTRLDRLDDEERAVIEGASVAGKVFYRGAVEDLCPEEVRPRVDPHLMDLVRKELIRPTRSTLSGEEAFRFRHILIRDAAYQGIPKELRAELHERFAGWIERIAGDRADEQEEILGYHLEQAYRYGEELGRVSDRERELARRASEHLAPAGRRAFARSDAPATANLLSRAASMLDADDPARLALLPDLGMALAECGEVERARATFDEAIDLAGAAGDERVRAHALVQRYRAAWEERWHERARPHAEHAIRVFEDVGDELGLARAWCLLGVIEWSLGRGASSIDALEQAFVHAGRAGDQREQAEVLFELSAYLVRGPTPVEQVIQRCEKILAERRNDRVVEGYMFHALAHVRARRGEFEEARGLAARHRSILQENGQALGFALSAEVVGDVEMVAGDPVAAERALREGSEALERMQDADPLLAAFLGRALYLQGRFEEAGTISEFGLSGQESFGRALAKGTLAKVTARQGRTEEAEELARQAVRLLEDSDFLVDRADVLMDLGEVLQLAGRPDEAARAVEEATRFYQQKGDVVSSGRARAVLAGLGT